MPTTDELLEQMEAEVLSTSAENRFIVDNNLRTITVPGSITVLGVEHDDDVHRLYFQMPKMYGEFDLSEFDIRINYVNAADKPDTYPVDDKETSGDNITFSWLVGRTAFEKMGEVKFNICLRKADGDGVVVKEFNTTIATLPPVLEGLETTELIVQQNPDVIESILQRLGVLEENGGGGGTSDYSDLENKPQLNGITLEGNKTLEDVGAQPKGNYLTSESDPTVPQWAKNPTKPTYTATEVGADASGTAESKVSTHNTSDDAHNDIRLLVQGLTTRLNALADSDDDTLDQMSEIVAYIKSNKSLIDGITTGKVNTSDIIDNLTTNVSNKPLSAAQGAALKALIDRIVVPEQLPNPHKLIFTGAVSAEYDGSTQQTINIPTGGGSDSYTLPIMSDTQLGGGKAVEKTDEDVPVAVDPSTGQLFVPTYPENTGGGGGTVDPEQIKQAVNGYLEENPPSGMTAEQEQQLNQNTSDVSDLKSVLEQKGLPEGGTTGQILKKKSDADYDAGWEDEKTGLLAQNQINSLYDLIKICAYTEIPTEKIKAFETAWGIESTDPEPPDGTKYTINRTLTNCTSSSSLLEIIEGQTLSEKITANSGFELSKVTVIMGGLDITSTVYSEGGINIASVSGDIEITAIAEEEASDVLFNMTMNRFTSMSKTPIVYSDEGQTQIEVPSNAVWYDSIEKIKSDGYVSIKFISKSDIYTSVYMAVREQGIDVKQVESFYYATEFTTNQLAGTNHLTKNIEYEIKANVKGDYMVCLIIGAPHEIASINAKLKSGGEL